jgi:hypothetical protein
MKINIFFIIISALSLIYSCGNRNPNITNKSIESSIANQVSNKNLLSEIKKFVLIVDSAPRSRELQNVILVTFNKNIDSLLVNIETSYYYPDSIDGYFFLDAYMVAFCNISLWHSNDLKSIFTMDTIPKKFRSETTVHYRAFEPRIKKYLFIKPDSLKLIKYTIY